jgi:hypothetical protein
MTIINNVYDEKCKMCKVKDFWKKMSGRKEKPKGEEEEGDAMTS